MSIEVKICSSLEKVFSSCRTMPDGIERVSALIGETANVQLVILSDRDCNVKVSAECDLPFKLYEVTEIFSGVPIHKEHVRNCTLLNNGDPGYYPDLLMPADGTIAVKADSPVSVWAEVLTDGGKAGEYTLDFAVKACRASKTASVKIRLADCTLPEQELIHTNWFHTDCLSVYYGVEVFSEDYWRITENFMANAAKHGVNCILTPLFTPPLDTEIGGERPTVQLVDVYKKGYTYTFGFEKLDRWVDTALKSGIKYFELSHLFTQWGAKCAPKIMAHTKDGYKRIFGWETNSVSQGYTSFLRQFAAALTEYTDKKGITKLCFVHCSDEPGMGDIARYRRTSNVIREYFGAYEHIDAMSDYAFYELGLMQTPVPQEGNIGEFVGKVPSLWTYYCCGQYSDELPNRFFVLPSVKNRMLGTLLYKYGCAGFLQWGFNFYFTQHSKRPVDPFAETDAGGAFPSGDSFIVYPGKDGEPLSSLRQKVFADGIRDISALKALEKKTSREYALAFIKEQLGDITFTDYPLDVKIFEKFREKLCEEVNR